MGLFKKLKKAFKKVTGFVKKVVKKVVKGVKKVAKKIGSSKILKALAIAAAVVVTGGAAIGAFTGGTATGFAGWMMNASNVVTSGTLFGTGATGIAGAAQTTGNFLTKMVAKPFASAGRTLGNVAAGVTDFTGLTTEAGRTGINSAEQARSILGRSGLSESEIAGLNDSQATALAENYTQKFGGVGNIDKIKASQEKAMMEQGINAKGPVTLADQQAAALKGAEAGGASSTYLKDLQAGYSGYGVEAAKTGFFDTTAGKVVSSVGTAVGTNVLTGAAMQYIQGDPQQQGSMAGAAYEGGDYLDPLKVYAAQQGINTDGIYQHMMYGNADPSSMYGNELYRQQTVGIA